MPNKFSYPPAYLAAIAQDEEGYFDWNLRQARDGDADSARELMQGFCSYVEQRKPIPAPILNYLYLSFANYLSGSIPIQKALLLNRPKHRPRNIHSVNPIRAVASLHLYIKRDNMGKESAKRKVENSLGVSVRNLERFDRDYNLIRNFSVAELLELLAEPRAPARKSL